MYQRILITVMSSVLSVTALYAAPFTNTQAEYSADSIMQSEDMRIESRVYVTPTKERHEMKLLADGGNPIQIIRKDTQVLWQLMPTEKMYMEISLDSSKLEEMGKKDMSTWDFEETVVGEEVLNGMKVTKYKTLATSTDGTKFGGFSWRTKEGIPLKVDLLFHEGDEKHRMTTELKNLKIAKQDPTLFEIPAGYQKFDMAGMMGSMGALLGGQGQRTDRSRQGDAVKPNRSRRQSQPSEVAPANPEPHAQDQPDLQKATDMMKKLFGR